MCERQTKVFAEIVFSVNHRLGSNPNHAQVVQGGSANNNLINIFIQIAHSLPVFVMTDEYIYKHPANFADFYLVIF